jgi:hypothetical protein
VDGLRLCDFPARYPEVEIRLEALDRSVDPAAEGGPSLTFGKVFHPSALDKCRKGQSLGRKRQNAVPDVYTRDRERERE